MRARWGTIPVVVLGLAAVYVLAGKLGLLLAFVHASATAVWPPTGIALAAFLLLGYRVWPGIFLGAFLVNLTTAGSVATTIGIATGNTLEGLAGAYLVNRFAHGTHAFDRQLDVFKFAVLAALASTTVSPFIGVTSLALGGYADWAEYGRIWLTWWLGDAGGALIVTPVVLLWSQDTGARWTQAQVKEVGLLLVTLLLVGLAVFGGVLPITIETYPLAFLCIPVLVWTAFRFSPRETATAVLLLSGMAIWGTLSGFGPFARETQNESLLLLQAFMGVTAVMTLALAAGVSEDRRAEAARRREEANTRAILDMALDAVIGMDEQGVITNWNPRAEVIFGWTAGEAVGKKLSEVVIPPQYREAHIRGLRHFLATGQGPVLNRRIEITALRRDGTEFPVELSILPFKVGASYRFNAFIADITERKRAEGTKARLAAIVESSDDAIIGKTLDGIVISWNRGAERIFGYTAEEVLGKPITMLFPPDRSDEEPKIIERLRRGERMDHFETVRRRKDGEEIAVSLTISSIKDETGTIIGISKIARDISERQRAKEELERLVRDLMDALAQVKTMKGLLPICASCKKIRSDEGYWKGIETYIEEHSEASFTHGICPDCAQKLYGYQPKIEEKG
jgi:PAS domain S-box-containing protein